MRQLRGARLVLAALTVLIVLGTASTALADPRYEVMNAPEGVYWRSEPNWAAAERITGFGVYNGTIIEVHCYQSGTAVEGSADTMWEQATDVGGSGSGSGWLNEHFINDGQPINQPSPGVPPCSAPPPPPPPPPPAPAGLIFTVFNAEGGIYYRNSPHWADTSATPGVGVYNGDQVELICGAFGDPVGPYNDTAWSYVNNLSRPVGDGWVNEHFINDGALSNEFVSGEPMCGSGTPGMSGGGSSGGGSGSGGDSSTGSGAPVAATPNAFYNRRAAVDWALAHAKDPQAFGTMCTWFVSRALWAGGFPQSSTWNEKGPYHYTDSLGFRSTVPGTQAAWLLPDFRKYFESHFSIQKIDITSDLTSNAVPQAEIGDLILYDWGKGEGISHVAIIVNIAPHQYPEVAEMSQWSLNLAQSVINKIKHITSPYEKRGWTWSAVHKKWLQAENPHMKAYLLHINGGYIAPTF